MIDLIKYIFDINITKVNNEGPVYEMVLEYIAEALVQLVELAHAFTTDKNNTVIMKEALLNAPVRKKITEKYKKYGEDQIELFLS
ncbi:unnamed protein product [Rhizopus stolonifer]